MDPSEPKRLGDYELLELVGTGAQGQVYKGRCISSSHGLVKEGEIVAVKVLARGSGDPKDDARFKRQARILEKLSHPGICRYIDFFIDNEGEWDERKCLVTEFLDGIALSERIRRYPRGLPWDEVQRIFDRCLDALCHASEQNVVHRDLKPSNIYLVENSEAKLIDFGIAREEGGEETSTTGWRGSFDYMAPDFVHMESFRGDEQSDIFSMAICFYMALTGALPFPAFGENAHIGYLQRWQAAQEARPNFKHGAFRVLTHLKPFVLKGLNSDRDDRFRTFNEMLDDFRKIRPRVVRHKGKDDYELVEMLGRGGFGEVFKGRRLSDGKFVAVKHLFAGRQSSRFIKEAQLLQKYKHPDIVEYTDFIEIEGIGDDKEFFLIMQYLPGMPGAGLNARIRRSRTGIDAVETTELFIHYLSALQYLHENPKPIIHRDIKPGNLYAPVGEPHNAKIFDLGVARDVTGTLTTGMIPGTLDYMAPEFASAGGDRGSPQTDLYAMGLSFYEALTGKKPFPRLPKADQEAFVAFVARAQDPPEVPYDHPVFSTFPQLVGIIGRAVAFDPKQRYARAGDMLAELERFLQEAIDAAGSEDVTMDAETRATIADPALIARLQAHREQQPSAIPESAIADLEASPVLSPAMERPEWLEDDEGLPTPGPAATPTPSPTPPPTGEPTPTGPPSRRKPWLALAVGAVILLLAGALVFVLLSGGGGPEDVAAPGSDQERVETFLADNAEALPEESYVRDLGLMLALARAAKHQDPDNRSWWDRQIADLTYLGEELPGKFQDAFTAAVEAGEVDEAARIQAMWSQLDDATPLMGITAMEHMNRSGPMEVEVGQLKFRGAVETVEDMIPAPIDNAQALAGAEAAYQELQVQQERPWAHVLPETSAGEFARLKTRLTTDTAAYVEKLRGDALDRYGRAEDAEPVWQELRDARDTAPELIGLVGGAYDIALSEVDQARVTSLRMAEFNDSVRQVRDRIPAAVDSPAALARVEEAAHSYEEFLSRTWDGVPEEMRTAVGEDLRSNLVSGVAAYVHDLRGTAMQRIEALEDPGAPLEALSAMGNDAPTAVGLLGAVYPDTVTEVRNARDRMVQTADYLAAANQLRASVPDPLDSPAQLAAANRAAAALADFAGRTWEGVTPDETAEVAAEVRAPLAQYVSAMAEALRSQALDTFGRDEDATRQWQELKGLRDRAPELVGLAGAAYDTAVGEVQVAYDQYLGKNAFAAALARIYETLPQTVRTPADLALAEQAARNCSQVQGQTWEGVSETEQAEGLAALRDTLAERSAAYVIAVREGAVERYQRLEDAAAERDQLVAAANHAPAIVEMLGDRYTTAMADVDAARDHRQRMVAFSEALEGIRQALPEQVTSTAELAQAESAAVRYTEVAEGRWEGVTDQQKTELLDPLREGLVSDAMGYVQTLGTTAMEQYEALEDADPLLEQLRAMTRAAPRLVAMMGPAHEQAVATVESARTKKENIARFVDAVSKIEAALPAEALDASAAARAEQVTATYQTVRDYTWPDISPTRKRQALDPIRDTLARAAGDYVKGLEATALERYRALEDGDPAREELALLKTKGPNLVGLVDATYASAVAAVDTAREVKLRKEEEMRAEQARLEAERQEQERLAALRAEEEGDLEAIEDAWAGIQASWAARDGKNLSAEYNLVLNGAFQVPEFQTRYDAVVQAFREQVRSVFGTELETADRAIAAFRSFLYQVSDPSLSGSYRAYREDAPAVGFALPPLENLEDIGLGVTQVRAKRYEAWMEEGPSLGGDAGRRSLSDRLRTLAGESTEAGALEEASLCEMESLLMTSEPAVFPGTLEDRAEPPELLRWRAHASYQPEVSALDVMGDLSRYASRSDDLNEYDLRLALFASYYSWRNFIEGEGKYAQRVRDQLRGIIAKADDETLGQAMDFLAYYAEGGLDGDSEYPGLYLMNALSTMSSDSELGKLAAAWLEANKADATYAPRLQTIGSQLDLLGRLLEG